MNLWQIVDVHMINKKIHRGYSIVGDIAVIIPSSHKKNTPAPFGAGVCQHTLVI